MSKPGANPPPGEPKDGDQAEVKITQRGSSSVTRNPTPKSIIAQSQARNSVYRIVILGILLGLLCIALGIAIACRPENVKDILLVISTIAAFLAGSGDFSRKDEK